MKNNFAILILILSLTACSTAVKEQPKEQPKAAAPEAECAGKLGKTGLCPDRAKSLMRADIGTRPAPPNGCTWVANELEMPGDEVLLYLSADCKGNKMTFDYAGGARKAELSYATSALGGDALKGHKLVEIYSAESDGKTAILENTRFLMKNRAEAAKCEVRPDRGNSLAPDALVVDVSAEDSAADKNLLRSACGPMGLKEGSQQFWRAFGGFAWFFSLGQEELEFDPGSLTLVRKDEKGAWVRVS
jgi:hypothetical protein